MALLSDTKIPTQDLSIPASAPAPGPSVDENSSRRKRKSYYERDSDPSLAGMEHDDASTSPNGLINGGRVGMSSKAKKVKVEPSQTVVGEMDTMDFGNDGNAVPSRNGGDKEHVDLFPDPSMTPKESGLLKKLRDKEEDCQRLAGELSTVTKYLTYLQPTLFATPTPFPTQPNLPNVRPTAMTSLQDPQTKVASATSSSLPDRGVQATPLTSSELYLSPSLVSLFYSMKSRVDALSKENEGLKRELEVERFDVDLVNVDRGIEGGSVAGAGLSQIKEEDADMRDDPGKEIKVESQQGGRVGGVGGGEEGMRRRKNARDRLLSEKIISRLVRLEDENKELGGLLSNGRIAELENEVQNLRRQVKERDDSLTEAHTLISELDEELESTQDLIFELRHEVRSNQTSSRRSQRNQEKGSERERETDLDDKGSVRESRDGKDGGGSSRRHRDRKEGDRHRESERERESDRHRSSRRDGSEKSVDGSRTGGPDDRPSSSKHHPSSRRHAHRLSRSRSRSRSPSPSFSSTRMEVDEKEKNRPGSASHHRSGRSADSFGIPKGPRAEADVTTGRREGSSNGKEGDKMERRVDRSRSEKDGDREKGRERDKQKRKEEDADDGRSRDRGHHERGDSSSNTTAAPTSSTLPTHNLTPTPPNAPSGPKATRNHSKSDSTSKAAAAEDKSKAASIPSNPKDGFGGGVPAPSLSIKGRSRNPQNPLTAAVQAAAASAGATGNKSKSSGGGGRRR